MASTLVITIKSARTQSDLARYIKDTTAPRQEVLALKQLFDNLASGVESASFDVQTSANAPVRATGTLTLTYASIANNDTTVIGGTTLTCVTGTPSGYTQFKKQTDATVTAANLVIAINNNTTLSKLVSASSALGVVTITSLMPGVLGNQITLVGSTGIVAGAANFASGAGGAETTKVSYSRGL